MALKLCPIHHKPYPCGQCRMESAKKPPQTPETVFGAPSAPAELVAPTPAKRRGRKPKGESAMTDVERKKLSRQNKKEKENDAQLHASVAKIIKEHRKMELADYGRLRKLGVDLAAVPSEYIQLYQDLLITIRDSTGRLHGERSGEAPSANGLSDMERIDAAQRRKEQFGTRVRPSGYGPVPDESSGAFVSSKTLRNQRRFNDSARSSYSRPPIGYASSDGFDEAIEALVAKFYESAECRLCGANIPDPTDAPKHFRDEYKNAVETKKHRDLLTQIDAPESVLKDALAKAQCAHYVLVHREIRESKERERSATRKAKAA